MSSVLKLLSRCKFTYFACSYSPTYTWMILHHILNDPYHPLYTRIKRKHAEREKTGLWWHATIGLNSSNKKIVRTWMRRRLRNAFIDELAARNINEDGKIQDGAALTAFPKLQALSQEGKDVSLEGSVKLHAMPPLIPAKYVDVRKETGMVIDALLQAMEMDLKHPGPPQRNTGPGPARGLPPRREVKPRSQNTGREMSQGKRRNTMVT